MQIDWLGFVGSITGVAGFVMGLVTFRRSGKFKAMDLRLELRKAQATLATDASELDAQLETAKKSRERLASAVGTYQSGATQHWLDTWQVDKTAVPPLLKQVAELQADCKRLPYEAIEEQLVKLHVAQRRPSDFAAKYRGSLADDDMQRSGLR